MDTETRARDHRRAQLLGDAWLEDWLADERDCARSAGTWVAKRIRPREEVRYVWIWIAPYRDLHPEHDAYRAQSAGHALLEVFAREVHPVSGRWVERAAETAGKSGEEWLFIPRVMHADGWRRTEKRKRPVWTKVRT